MLVGQIKNLEIGREGGVVKSVSGKENLDRVRRYIGGYREKSLWGKGALFKP